MNIEEERKAFEASLVKASNEESAIMFIRNESSTAIAVNIVEALFEIWLAAKAHAAEMARQGCFIQYDADRKWWIVIPGKMRQGTYDTKEEAEQRAVREGLRIDTPPTEFLDVY